MGEETIDLYIDDSGSRLPDKKEKGARIDRMDAFALGGIIVGSEDSEILLQNCIGLRKEFGIGCPLHSNEIRSFKGPWKWLKDKPVLAQQFYERLTEIIKKMPAFATGCVVDRPGYNKRYRKLYGAERWKLCKTAYTILVERSTKYAIREGRRLRIYVEESGKHEDRAIREYHRELQCNGMYFDANTSRHYEPLGPESFSSTLIKNPNFVTKGNLLMQLADLVLYPIVKGAYDPSYPPYKHLLDAGRLIDNHLSEEEKRLMRIKYFCFDEV